MISNQYYVLSRLAQRYYDVGFENLLFHLISYTQKFTAITHLSGLFYDYYFRLDSL